MLCGLFLAYVARRNADGVCLRVLRRVARVGSSITPGARILLVPGAFALWPYILFRWLKAGR